jgi:protocatechuate 3,4-dioxygenase beta subunit
MSRSRFKIFCCNLGLALWCVAVVVAQSTPPTPSTQKPGTATVSGRITLGDKPAAGVAVGLLKTVARAQEDMVPIARATTDDEGRYRMTNVTAGRFRLQALAPGLVTEEQKADVYTQGRTLNLNEGENVENMDFKLTKGGVIAGKVTDANGRPMIAGRISLYEIQADGRKQQTQPASSFMMMQTDDRGEYRLFGLAEGRYVVGAGVNNPSQPRPTYHPNTTSQDEAAVIEVKPGSESLDVDIRLNSEKNKTFSITARVVDVDTGQPVPNTTVGYRTLGANEALNSSYVPPNMMSDARGNVRLDNLAAGRYGIGVSNFGYNGQSEDYYGQMTPVELTDSDVDGVEIRVQRGLTVSGVAVIEGVNDPATVASLLAKLGMESGSAYSRGAQRDDPTTSRNFSIKRDGTFRITGLAPGLLMLGLNQRNAPGFMISRIEAEQVNERREVVLNPGQSLAGVKLVLAYGTALIRGQMQVINGALPPGARTSVNLHRADPPRQFNNGRFAEVDARGSFVFEGVPAGEYEIVLSSLVRTVVVTNNPGGGTTTTTTDNPTTRPLTTRQKIVVPASGEVPVTMTLDVAPPPNPPKE